MVQLIHANHPQYNDWVQEALIAIDKANYPIDELYGKMESFGDILRIELEAAYNLNFPFNAYFIYLAPFDILTL